MTSGLSQGPSPMPPTLRPRTFYTRIPYMEALRGASVTRLFFDWLLPDYPSPKRPMVGSQAGAADALWVL